VARWSAPAFVRAHTALGAVSFVPEVSLHLARADSTDLWEATQELGGDLGGSPPFWSFAWAGGLALARYLLDGGVEVEGRTVHDVGCGSGLVAIAAAMRGAGRVVASDVDPLAVAAARLNAATNRVRVTARQAAVTDLAAGPGDLLVAGDVFYDRQMAEQVLTALRGAVAAGAEVLVGDPQRTYLPTSELTELARYEVPVDAELESAEVKTTVVCRLAGS
jgi:predicted nicotinamide N-methyase